MKSCNIKSYIKFFLVLLFIFLISEDSYSQFPIKSREDRLLERADESYAEQDYVKAIERYRDLITRFGDNADVLYKLAKSYQEIDNPARAEMYFNRIIRTDDQSNPIVHLSLGQVNMMQGKYVEARTHFLKYNELLEYNDQLAMRYISSIENIDRYFEDSAYYTQQNLPINSASSDFGATTLENSFYFLSTRDNKDDLNERYSSDLFIADVEGDMVFNSPKKISGPANTRFGEIGYTILPETNEIFICRYEPGQQDEFSLGYSIYKAFIGVNKEITKPQRFNMENFRYAIAYPTLSPNGKFMIFASDAPGGFGGWDLYKADYADGNFVNIINMGDKINSAGDELYPYMLNDTIIFYATNGQGGIGGFDIYSKDLTQPMDYAQNMGYPINSSGNDYGIYFDSGLSGYFTSNRNGGKGNDDIYRFTIHQLKLAGEIIDQENGDNLKQVNIKINRSSGNSEVLALADNGRLILNALPGEELEITVEKEGYETKSFKINTNEMSFVGNHTVVIGKLPVERILPEPIAFELEPSLIKVDKPANIFFAAEVANSKTKLNTDDIGNRFNNKYDVTEFYDGKLYRYFVKRDDSYFIAKEVWKELDPKENYLVAYIEDVSTRVMKALKIAHVEPAEEKDPEVHDFINKTQQIGSRIVYYGLDKFRVPDGYDDELNYIVEELNKHPEYFLEIAAHTDKRGSDMYNRALSEERAKFMRQYFLDKGIPELRIIAHGIGEKQLKNYCADCTEEDHKQNRRAELILREYKD